MRTAGAAGSSLPRHSNATSPGSLPGARARAASPARAAHPPRTRTTTMRAGWVPRAVRAAAAKAVATRAATGIRAEATADCTLCAERSRRGHFSGRAGLAFLGGPRSASQWPLAAKNHAMDRLPEHGRAHSPLGGVVHTYQKYDPKHFPSPTVPPPDLASAAFEHMLMFGSMRRLSEEELARAVHLDPLMFPRLGPSLEALRAMLEERKRKILATYETDTVQGSAGAAFRDTAGAADVPKDSRKRFDEAVREEQLGDLERLWYQQKNEQGAFAKALMGLIRRLGDKYQVDELASKYAFTGRVGLTIPRALEVKEELEAIDRLLEQLREAAKNAQLAVIDMESLSEFAEPGDVENLNRLQEQIEDYLREQARSQGLEFTKEGYQLSPQAYRLFQRRLLQEIFSDLEAARSGRHSGPVTGEGAVEIEKTKPYEFGDAVAHMDVTQTVINAAARRAGSASDPARKSMSFSADDITIH